MSSKNYTTEIQKFSLQGGALPPPCTHLPQPANFEVCSGIRNLSNTTLFKQWVKG